MLQTRAFSVLTRARCRHSYARALSAFVRTCTVGVRTRARILRRTRARTYARTRLLYARTRVQLHCTHTFVCACVKRNMRARANTISSQPPSLQIGSVQYTCHQQEQGSKGLCKLQKGTICLTLVRLGLKGNVVWLIYYSNKVIIFSLKGVILNCVI